MKGDELLRVLAGLNARSQVEAFEAAKAVWNDTDVRLERASIKTLKRGLRPFNRAAAAYAMGAMLHRPQVIAALEHAVDNNSETPRVRGESAETLHLNHRKKSHDLLLRNLTDPSKESSLLVCLYSRADDGTPGHSGVRETFRFRQKDRQRLSLSCKRSG